MKPLLVLRPEPGNSATADRARALGLDARQCPLFAIEPLAWHPPQVLDHDFLLLTSANALRHGGANLDHLKHLGVLAVGAATADAARAAGFTVALTGDRGVEALLAALPESQRLLHLTAAHHHRPPGRHAIETLIAYRATPLSPALPTEPLVALVHSPRAGARIADLARNRARITIAAISPAAAAACGTGWAALHAAPEPSDAALLALAARLCQD